MYMISDFIPKTLNKVIPVLIRILEHCNAYKAACYPTRCEVINDIKLFPTVGYGLR